jgi:hypothetical protein
MEFTGSHNIAIRLATGADTAALVRLAALDSAEVPSGRVLVAFVGGSLVAARSLSDGASVADPFRATADVRDLLALRASQLPPSHPRRRYLPRRRRGVGAGAGAGEPLAA